MKILSFVSIKGGVGKSLISANFGTILAKSGHKTALVCAEKFSSLDVIFKIQVNKNLGDFLNGKCEFNDILYEVRDNLFLIVADNCENFEKLRENLLKIGFEYILIDANSGFYEQIVKISDDLLLISSCEPAGVSDTYAFIKLASRIRSDFLILTNMTNDEEEAVLIYENLVKIAHANISKDLKFGLLGFVGFCEKIRECVKNRTIFCEEMPNSDACYQLCKAVGRYLKKNGQNGIDLSKFSSFSAFFRRIFS